MSSNPKTKAEALAAVQALIAGTQKHLATRSSRCPVGALNAPDQGTGERACQHGGGASRRPLFLFSIPSPNGRDEPDARPPTTTAFPWDPARANRQAGTSTEPPENRELSACCASTTSSARAWCPCGFA